MTFRWVYILFFARCWTFVFYDWAFLKDGEVRLDECYDVALPDLIGLMISDKCWVCMLASVICKGDMSVSLVGNWDAYSGPSLSPSTSLVVSQDQVKIPVSQHIRPINRSEPTSPSNTSGKKGFL